eukprot:jgi/Undpi1/3177/HiC_scaffold_15.g06551.m1
MTTNALAFGAASFASSVLCTLFSMYVTPVFTSVYQARTGRRETPQSAPAAAALRRIKDSHFYASHVVFAIWNAVNDPAFAWLIDNTTASGGNRRLPAIKYGGPLWCLAFLIPWWPWSSVPGSWLVGLHFAVSICMFDSFLTYVLLVHCALLADLTTDNKLRNNYNNVGSLLGVAGGAAGAMSYHLYDGNAMGPFRCFCLGAAAMSCYGFWWTGTRLDVGRLDSFKRQVPGNRLRDPFAPLTPPRGGIDMSGDSMRSRSPNTPGSGVEEGDALMGRRSHRKEKAVADAAAGAGVARKSLGRGATTAEEGWGTNAARGGRELSFLDFAKQLISHGNFWLYVSMNFVENFNALFDQSFFVFLDTKLFAQAVPRGSRGVLTALCLYLPKVMTQVLTPVADRFGTYRVIMWAAAFKLVAGSLMCVVGAQAWPLWTLLFLGNRLAATAWGFYNLSFADVIDEDTLRNRRPESMSCSVHGVQALFVKPAQSLAPMLGMAFLPRGALKTDLTDMTSPQADSVRAAAFTIMWAVPVGCGALQVLIWRAYRLHGAALKDMKKRLREWELSLSNEGDKMANMGMA